MWHIHNYYICLSARCISVIQLYLNKKRVIDCYKIAARRFDLETLFQIYYNINFL